MDKSKKVALQYRIHHIHIISVIILITKNKTILEGALIFENAFTSVAPLYSTNW